MDLSICILTHNQPELLTSCVLSCIAEVERAQVQAEILIVDNATADGYPQRLSAIHPSIRIIRSERNLGFSSGNNVAIRSSQGRHVLILNDDTELQEGSLALLIRVVESCPEIGAVGPKLLNPDGSLQVGFTNKKFPRIRGLLSAFLPFSEALYWHRWTRNFLTEWNDGNETGETDYVAGACLLIRRAALDAVGLFDESFRFWLDDTDLCYRLKESGYTVFYLADARVVHHGSASIRRVLGRSERHTILLRSLNHYFRKHYGPLRCLAVRLSLAVAYLIRIPAVVLARAARGGSALAEAGDSVGASLSALRVLLLE